MVRIRKFTKSDSDHDVNQIKDSKKKKSSNYLIYSRAAVIFVCLASIFFSHLAYKYYQQSRVINPLSAPKVIQYDTTSVSVSPEKFWGSYRPNTYLGLKTRSPQSPVVGIMWFSQTSPDRQLHLRHWCDQGDHLDRYGWIEHDGINFGSQEIIDKEVVLKTDFVKRNGGNHGGDWTIKIIASSPKDQEPRPSIISLLFYIALDGQGLLQPELVHSKINRIHGQSQELGIFSIKFKEKSVPLKTNYLMANSPGLHLLKEIVTLQLKPYNVGKTGQILGLSGNALNDKPLNFLVHQITITLPFEMEIIFESQSFINRPNELSGEIFANEFNKFQKAFHNKFDTLFSLPDKGYEEKYIEFAKAALSNMIGSIGYFYGSSLIQSDFHEEPVEYWPAALYTAVPSRSFFPRGFLWDEGFHNLLISQWDPYTTKEIIGHWLDLMNSEGWIPREQILGLEARSKVPKEFIIQKNKNANPPTFFLAVQYLIKNVFKQKNDNDIEYLKAIFPRLKAWYDWFNITQTGNVPGAYRWRGRDSQTNKELNPKTLTSGLDDYPRASHPTDEERHIDLRCWMALASEVMADIAKVIGEQWQQFSDTHLYLTNNIFLDDLHWSNKTQSYGDYGLHTNHIKLKRPKLPDNHPNKPQQMDMIRIVSKEPEIGFVDTFGYVGLFPFLTQIINPDSSKLGTILEDLRKPHLLWTKYGLRSLAKLAPLYNKRNTEHDPPYWRGAIWINMNFLAVRALHHYASIPGPYQKLAADIYHQLRQNLVQNIYKEYERTGYIWEQYNDETGHGQYGYPFTGWSALIVLIMAESY